MAVYVLFGFFFFGPDNQMADVLINRGGICCMK